MNAQLKPLFELATNRARLDLHRDDETRPAFYFQCADGAVGTFLATGKFGDAQSKDRFARLCVMCCIAYSAPASVVALETWMVQRSPAYVKKHGKPLPSEQDDRIELLVLVGESTTGDESLALPYIRFDNRKFFNFGDTVVDSQYKVEGRFSHLRITPDKPVPSELQNATRHLLKLAGVIITP